MGKFVSSSIYHPSLDSTLSHWPTSNGSHHLGPRTRLVVFSRSHAQHALSVGTPKSSLQHVLLGVVTLLGSAGERLMRDGGRITSLRRLRLSGSTGTSIWICFQSQTLYRICTLISVALIVDVFIIEQLCNGRDIYCTTFLPSQCNNHLLMHTALATLHVLLTCRDSAAP